MFNYIITLKDTSKTADISFNMRLINLITQTTCVKELDFWPCGLHFAGCDFKISFCIFVSMDLNRRGYIHNCKVCAVQCQMCVRCNRLESLFPYAILAILWSVWWWMSEPPPFCA